MQWVVDADVCTIDVFSNDSLKQRVVVKIEGNNPQSWSRVL